MSLVYAARNLAHLVEARDFGVDHELRTALDAVYAEGIPEPSEHVCPCEGCKQLGRELEAASAAAEQRGTTP